MADKPTKPNQPTAKSTSQPRATTATKSAKAPAATTARPSTANEEIILTDEEIVEETITEDETTKAMSKKNQSTAQPKTSRNTFQKVLLGIIIILALGLGATAGVMAFLFYRNADKSHEVEVATPPEPIYSTLTGLEISDEALNSKPTFCIQIPNGGDGARPQAGLNQAGVVFEAIAESGITRFAAVFQNPTVSAIGPIRSLRPYYLSWDLPFDCTIVHSGGSDEAIANLAASGQHDLDENLTYMWREYNSSRGWNNLFTSTAYLDQYSINSGKQSSKIKGFSRLTPKEAAEIAEEQACDANADETCEANPVNEIEIDFGISAMYNTIYNYDSASNTYYRSYATGENHTTYDCPAGIEEPNTVTACGQPVQVAPSVVIAMHVYEQRMNDNYHEDITTRGTGAAEIFQNGTVIEGSWFKASDREQIIFRDNDGNEIKLAPGQIWIAAVPQYGDVRC